MHDRFQSSHHFPFNRVLEMNGTQFNKSEEEMHELSRMLSYVIVISVMRLLSDTN